MKHRQIKLFTKIKVADVNYPINKRQRLWQKDQKTHSPLSLYSFALKKEYFPFCITVSEKKKKTHHFDIMIAKD